MQRRSFICIGNQILYLGLIMVILINAITGSKVIDKKLYNTTVKTIKSEDGDIIDCVDIYKQPAFDHPLLRNHIIQMMPSTYSKLSKSSFYPTTQQIWKRKGSCPNGKIPIRRTQMNDLTRVLSSRKYGQRSGTKSYSTQGHENVALVHKDENNDAYGAKASINIWNIHVEPNEYSDSKITLLSGDTQNASIIQAGWMVNPGLFGNNQTRFFTYWTGDGFGNTGCFNLLCPGFIQVSKEIALGASFFPVSIYGGTQHHIEISVYKDPRDNNWWLQYETIPIGYWPISIFGDLESAFYVQWGGEVLNTRIGGQHTTTQMGSGHFSNEGQGKSSYFRNILVVDASNKFREPNIIGFVMDNPNCYNISYEGQRWDKDQGYYFFYGGPGRGFTCS